MRRRNITGYIRGAIIAAAVLICVVCLGAVASSREFIFGENHGTYALFYALGEDGESYRVKSITGGGDVEIPAERRGYPVTAIGDSAMKDNDAITSVTIPYSVTEIGSYAFQNCTGLVSVSIGSGVTDIGIGAFENCSSLTQVTIPDSVRSIGSYSFRNCISLSEVTIGKRVNEIGNDAFYGCSHIKNVYYTGTAEEWDDISMGGGNTRLENATRYYV